MVDSAFRNESMDIVSVTSDLDAAADDIRNDDTAPTKRRWWPAFQRRGKDNGAANTTANSEKQSGNLAVICRSRSVVQASFLIIIASVVELLGNLLALVYGIGYIQSASTFYELDSFIEMRTEGYNEKLEEVLFLEKNKVGFVGVLGTSAIGIIIAFLMPIGAIYRSWKTLRAAMSLLFSVCMAHLLLASFFSISNILLASLVAIPFRLLEMFLIYNHINYYKMKKLREARKMSEGSSRDNNDPATVGSSSNLKKSQLATQKENKFSRQKKVSLDGDNKRLRKTTQEANNDDIYDDEMERKNRRSKKSKQTFQREELKLSSQDYQ